MPDLAAIEKALRAADAAGNVEDARRLAQAYAQARGQSERPDFSNVAGGVQSTDSTPHEAEQPSWLDTELRGIGLSARSAMQGTGGLVGAIGGDAFNKLLPGDQPSYHDAAGMLADKMGLPSPQNGRERVLGDVGEALTGTGLTMGGGAMLPAASKVNAFLTAQPVAQVAGAVGGATAGGVARENGASPGGQLAASLAGATAPGGLTSAASGLTRLAVRGGEAGRAAVEKAIRDFGSVGATPSVGQATGGRAAQGVESLLSASPTSNGVVTRFAEKQADSIGDGLRKQADQLSPNASAERAGRQVEQGADTFKGNTTATKKALYWQADKHIPANTPVSLQNTWQEVVRLTSPNAGAQATTAAMVSPKIAKLRDTLEQDLAAGGGNVSYEALRRIRSDIGEAITDFTLSPDASTREYKAIYGALSRDMESAAQKQGPQAVAAAKRANNYTRAAADRLETLSRVVDKNGGPEKIYTAVMSGTRDGGTTLRSVMQSLPAESQRSLTAAVIKRMGLANPGAQDAAGEAFSAQTFLTNWNKVSPEARKALFDRHGPSFVADMDKISRVAQTIRDGSKVYANPSGTANKAAALTYLASLGGAAATGQAATAGGLVTAGVIANISARAMTNPKIVRWLANSTKMPAGAALASLQIMAQRDEDASELLQKLRAEQAKKN